MWEIIIPAVADYAVNQYQTSKQNSLAKKTSSDDFWMNFAVQNYFMDKQNEYNKPVNQMKRLQEAGLNPNLVYGSGNAIMSSAGPSGGGKDTDLTQSSARLNMLSAIQVLRNQKLQEKQIDANIDSTNANINLAKARLALQAQRDEQLARDSKDRIDLMAQALGLRRRQFEESKKPKWRKFIEGFNNFLDDNLGKPEEQIYFNDWNQFGSAY